MDEPGFSLDGAQATVFVLAGRTLGGFKAILPPVHVVRGREAIIAMQPLLSELARRTGQCGALDWLEHILTDPFALRKIPYLLLVGRRAAGFELPDPAAITVDDLQGAVLVHEYRFAGFGTRVFATDDVIGRRTVIAEPECRLEVAACAMRELIRSGSVMAFVSLDGALSADSPSPQRLADPSIFLRTRIMPRYLALGDTMEKTLAQLGSDTRRNFRRYRRRVEAELAPEFVASVQLSREDFLDMNRRSTNPAGEAVAEWRYRLHERMAGRPDCVCAGLRGGDGQWISLIGGRRIGDTIEIDWQFNVAGLPRYSLTTVMRSYLIEHEIALGTKRLICEGGTPHPMQFSFETGVSTDLLAVRRRSVRAWLLRHFPKLLFPKSNFLGAALHDWETVQY